MSAEEKNVVVGRIAGVYGVRGWVRVQSYTSPAENILDYTPWSLGGGRQVVVVSGRRHGSGLAVQLDGIKDRDGAALLIGSEIAVPRAQLPAAAEGEYYWADLIGLRVVNLEGVELGRVDHLFETGANDVLVVRGGRERLIPYVLGQAVQEVRLDKGLMRVDWDPEF